MRLLKGDKHRRWQQGLSAYIDGYLEPHAQQALQRHLAECIPCQEELEALRGVVALLHRVPQVPVPRSFTLSQAPIRKMWWATRYSAPLRYATAAAALLLLAVAVGDLVTGQPPIAAPAGPAAMERRDEQAPEGTLDDTALTAIAPAALPGATPTPQPMAATALDKAEEAVAPMAFPTPATEETRDVDTLFRWAEVALGAILAVMAALVAIQWRLSRRRRQG